MVATTITILGMSMTVGNLLLTVGSIAYQMNQAAKMKARMKAAEEARKGFEFTRRGEAMNLPVFYGYNKVGSLVTDFKVASSYTWSAPAGYNVSQYLPSPTTYEYDASNYVFESKVKATDITDQDNPKNITEHTVRVVWDGVEVYNEYSPTPAGSTYLATEYSKIENELSNVRSGSDRYYMGPKVTKSVDTSNKIITYKYKIRKVLGYATSSVFGTDRGHTGSKNEVLLTQNAICFSGINALIDLDINDTSASNDKFKDSYVVNFYSQGGLADPMASANGFRSTNLFTSTAYASCAFVLNRDDPQYSSDLPALSFYIEGQRIHDITYSNGVYALSAEKSFSNNPARVLLDYLTNSEYGRGLSVSNIDLKSFYNAKLVCDTVVATKPVSGKVYGGSRPSAIKLFEFNDVIDTEQEVRSNIDRILQSMHQAYLVWSGGQYKLQLSYPTENPSVSNGYVAPEHVFTDADLIQNEVVISWPKAESKYNQVTIRFANAFKNFKSDSVTWPATYSAVHMTYLAEDNNQPLKTETSVAGITDPYHALARAEELVRSSRTAHTLKAKFSRKAIKLEPGDFFLFKSETVPISSTITADSYEIYKVTAIEYDAELNCSVTANSFDYRNLAWNVDDFVAYVDTIATAGGISAPTNVLFSDNVDGILGVQSGKLTWGASSTSEVDKYVVEISADNGVSWSVLGETYTTQFDVVGLNTGVYQFAVRSKTIVGRQSERKIAEDEFGNLNITIQRATSDQVAVIYADSADFNNNTQSYDSTGNTYVAYYIYSGDLPTLPVRSDISFSKFVGEDSLSAVITTSNGTVFRNDDGSPKTLTANLYIGGVESTTYNTYTYKWYYNNALIYMDSNRNVLDYNGQPLTDPVVAATIPGSMLADSTQSSSYNGSLREIIVGPEDVNLSTKFKVEIGNI